MRPILTREEWLKQKAAYEAFNRWEEEHREYLDIPAAAARWWDLVCLYRRLHPDAPPVDLEKYEHLERIRRALAVLR